MKKILIADDEYLVRLGLKTTVDWEGHGFSIVGEAANGQEALEIFQKTDPDILLTDIRMPVMDGLMLIEKLKARKPSLYVVILTHYNDFAYAQKAILLGASQYILKSELNEKSILDTLARVTITMEAAEPAHSPKSVLREYLRECLLLPAGGKKMPPAPAQALLPGLYMAVACRCGTQVLPTESQEMFYKSIRVMLEKVWDEPVIVSVEQSGLLRIYLMLPLSQKPEDATLAADHMHLAAANIRQYYEVEFQAGISMPHDEVQLQAMLLEAEEACDDCFFSNDFCITYQKAQRPIEEALPRVNQARLQDLVGARDWPKLKSYISGVFQELMQRRSIRHVRTAYIDFLSTARLLTSRYATLSASFLSEKKLDYQTFQDLNHIRSVEVCVLDIYRTMLDVLSGTARRYSSVINRCIDFIKERYMDNIALSDAADAVNVSKSYLSLLFKQETGINFSKYLMDFRVEKGKELLKDTTLKIYEVAERVGFPNPYYFSKVFKETTGFSCKDFKNFQN